MKLEKLWTPLDQVSVFIDIGTYEWRFNFTVGHRDDFTWTSEGGARDSLLHDAIEAFCQENYGRSYDDAMLKDSEIEALNNKANWSIRTSANKYTTLTGQQLFFITVYEVDRVCMGPEEGGDWRNVGTVERIVTASSLEVAETYRDVLRKQYPHTGKSSSVVYRGGDYSIEIDVRPGEDYGPGGHYE